jgi:hypothetical protein
MTHPLTPLEQAFARIRISAEADAAACAHVPTAVEAMLLALLLRLLGQLERLARTWHAGTHPVPAGQSRSQARIASGLVPPRAQRPERFLDWWLRMNFGRGMRPAAHPPSRPLRARQATPCPVRAPPA